MSTNHFNTSTRSAWRTAVLLLTAISILGLAGNVSAQDSSTSDSVSIFQPSNPAPQDKGSVGDKLRRGHLFWAEPVTSMSKNVPHVASDEMKLLAVHGTVSVTTPGGATKPGTNGMIVPSGSTVAAAKGSSAAVLMGGVNSIRLVPDSNVAVTQSMAGNVRHTAIDLKSGAVFSRVGRRDGETEDYQVRTPEGVAAARGTEYLDGIVHVTVDGVDHEIHVVYVKKGTVELLIDGKSVGQLKGTGSLSDIAMGAMGKPKLGHDDLMKYLEIYLKEIQAFNMATIQAIFDYEDQDATAEDLALLDVQLYGSIPDGGPAFTADDQLFLASAAASFQDLLPPTKKPTAAPAADEVLTPPSAPTSE